MHLIRGLMVLALAVTGAVAVTPHSAKAVGWYGPNTCLEGYVWREAFPGDDVCVTPDRRQQTADENAQAASLVDPNGAYGPDTCINGYVWREAGTDNPVFPLQLITDHVCVTPDIRSQVWEENNVLALPRILEPDVWVMNDQQQNLGQPFLLWGTGFNPGQVWVGIYRTSDNALLWGTDVTAVLGGDPDSPQDYGFDNLQAGVGNCDETLNYTDYIALYDWTAQVWSRHFAASVC
jgi:hypothetical protein